MSIIRAEEISIIEHELSNLGNNDLAIFDCDDVLTTIRAGAFKPNNRDFLNKWIRSSGVSKDELYDKFRVILRNEEGSVVNSRMINLINRLNEKEVKHMVLTSYSVRPLNGELDPVNWRVKTLKEFGYDFSKLWDESYIELLDFMSDHNPIFKHGILCCDIFPKSECLEKFLDYVNWKPNKIVFVDDLLRNLSDVEDFCKSQKISYVGIEYLESQKITSYIPFSESIGQFQLDTLKNETVWLSDEDANKLIN